MRVPEGMATLRALIANGDVFMENLNPAKLASLDIDPEKLRTSFRD